MSDLWYKKVGFFNNPFSIKPAAFDNELVAYDMSYIYKKIETGEMIFIEGVYGSGKTTILKNIISHFQGRNKIIYYSFNTSEGFNLNALLDGANSFFRKVAGLKIKNIILLLDEVHTMKTMDAKKLIKPYKDGVIKSVIFVSHDITLTNYPEEIVGQLQGNIIKTVDLSAQEAIALVRKRIGNLDILSDKIITRIFLLADKNPRRLLEYCEDVTKYAVEIGDTKVTDYHIEEVLGNLIREKQRKETVKKEEKPKIKQPPRKKVNTDVTSDSSAEENTAPEPDVKVETKDQDDKDLTIEIKELPSVKDQNREKKFKLNKLVSDEKKNTLGTIVENGDEEEKPKDPNEDNPEYKIYFVDE